MKRISFSSPLPQAIREGRKTQTRREIKPQPKMHGRAYNRVQIYQRGNHWEVKDTLSSDGFSILDSFTCPYKVGDVLAVLEEHYMFGHWEPDNTRKRKTGRQAWKFVQDSKKVLYRENPPTTYRKGRHSEDPSTPAWHKRLARFMPSHAVRTYIELTDIKAEQLKDISEEDAIAEGVQFNPDAPASVSNKGAFAKLWQSINGEDSWNANPWVWVFEFKQVEKPIV